MSDPKIIVALDYPQAQPALDLVARLEPSLCRLKVARSYLPLQGHSWLSNVCSGALKFFLI